MANSMKALCKNPWAWDLGSPGPRGLRDPHPLASCSFVFALCPSNALFPSPTDDSCSSVESSLSPRSPRVCWWCLFCFLCVRIYHYSSPCPLCFVGACNMHDPSALMGFLPSGILLWLCARSTHGSAGAGHTATRADSQGQTLGSRRAMAYSVK